MCTLSIKPTLITMKIVIVKDTFSSKWSVASKNFTTADKNIKKFNNATFSISHSLTFFVNISDFKGTFSDGM